MIFASPVFLWLFFPIVFLISRILPIKIANIWLLIASIVFYAWGEPVYIILMLLSIAFNYLAGIAIDKLHTTWRKITLIGTIAVNLGLLGYFKYFDFLARLVNTVLNSQAVLIRDIALPVGISFYTFQILSYIIDLYRDNITVQKNPLNLALYIAFFPQLTAGPIVNYKDIEHDLTDRNISLDKTAYGIKRFIYGMAKKVLIANTLAQCVDNILALKPYDVPAQYLWFAYLLYFLQIYFDFSGYSDMAIGLGKMFGFTFMENFNYPYISQTITEFWRRWHISLSTWFRDYLYIPLGGNRKGLVRTCINLVIVFILTGLWHGAGLNFLAWGLWHGFFLILERLYLKKWLEKPRVKIFAHLYTIIVVFFGWVFFRAGSFTLAFETIKYMFTFNSGNPSFYYQAVAGPSVMITAVAGLILCGPLQAMFPKIKARLYDEKITGYAQTALLAVLLLVCVIALVSGSYNPFIYYRF